MTNQTLIEDLRLVDIPPWWQNPWNWLIIALVSTALIWFIRRFLASGSIPLKPVAPIRVGPPPHVEALKRLEELRAQHSALPAYDVALRCSDILRRYIEARFDLPIRFQTTREFLGAVYASPELSGDSRNELGEFLKFFDAIKFAREKASTAQNISAIDGAEGFVRRCIPSAA